MTARPDILCIGAVLWDIIGRAPQQMRLGSDVAGRIARIPGGVALNIAMGLKSFGLAPALLSAVGHDAEGRDLIRACEALGIDASHIYRADHLPTDCYMAIEGSNGVIAAIADAHSLEAAGQEILNPLGEEFAGWDGLVALDGNLTVALLSHIASGHELAQADLRVAPASPGKAERLSPFLSHPNTTLYANLEEAGLLLGRPFKTSKDAATALTERGLKRAVVTDGPRPATTASGQKTITLSPVSVPVQRVTGAGDIFMAAHITAEASGADEPHALQSALDAAAAYISGNTA